MTLPSDPDTEKVFDYFINGELNLQNTVYKVTEDSVITRTEGKAWDILTINKLAAQISRTIRSSGIEHIKNPNGQHLTVTIGVVNVDMTQSDDTILDIIKCADKALYFAKDQGRDVVYGYRATSEEDHDYRRISV